MRYLLATLRLLLKIGGPKFDLRSELSISLYLFPCFRRGQEPMTPKHPIHRSLRRLLSFWQNVQTVEQAAGEVARQCRDMVWQRIYPRTAEMSIAQIRGYIRAQAATVVDGEVDLMSHRRHLAPSLRAEIRETALALLVGGVIHDVLSEELPAGTRTLAA